MTPKELRSRRLALGWSTEKLAAAVGYDAETVASWEQGDAQIACPAALEQILRAADERLLKRRRGSLMEDRGAARRKR